MCVLPSPLSLALRFSVDVRFRCLDYHDEGSPPSRYTFRGPDESATSSTELQFGQYANASIVPNGLSRRLPTCDLSPETDGSDVCPVGCDEDVTCTGTASTRFELSTSCSGSSGAEACTPIRSDGIAGCCDKDIRLYFDTTANARGAPQDLTGWTTYDPRTRTWYTEERERSDDTGGWSSIYVFSTSGELGITRTGKLRRSDGVTYGILGIDFELHDLSQILTDTVAGREGAWAYVVEAATGELVGTTFSAPLRDDSSFERYSAASIATASTTVKDSAVQLAQEAWRPTTEGQVLTNTVPGELTAGAKYEATAQMFAFDGLNWLIVVGQDIQCGPNEIYLFGACEECAPGQVPLDDRNCLICNDEYPGTVSDSTGTKCVCPEGTYAVRDGEFARCEPCVGLPASVVGVRDRNSDPIAWEDADICPGSVNWQTRICPLHQLWIEVEEPGVGSNTGTETKVNLLTCPACVSAPCANSSVLERRAEAANINIPAIGSDWSSEDWLQVQPKAVCRDHHTGFLCAECKTNYKAIEGECILCDKTDWHCEAFAARSRCHWLQSESALTTNAVLVANYIAI